MTKEDLEPEAKRLYLLGQPILRISKILRVTEPTIHAWKKKFNWEGQMEKHKAQIEEETQEIFERFRKGVATAGSQLFLNLFKKIQKQLESGENAKIEDLVKVGKMVEEVTRPASVIVNQSAVDVLDSRAVMEAAIRGANNANREDKTGDNKSVQDKQSEF